MVADVMSRRRAIAFVGAAGAAAFTAGLPGVASVAAQDPAGFTTQARFLNANTDGGEYEVFINGDNVLDSFGYGDESDWIDLDPGAVRLTLTADRTGFNYVMFDAVYPVAAGSSFNVIITDALVIGSAIDAGELSGEMARVRVTHASTDTPGVDVVVAGGDPTIASDLRYGRSSDYIEIPAGSYDVDIVVTESGEPLISQSGVTVEAGMVYDLVVMGTAGDEDKPLTVTSLASAAGGAAEMATRTT